ncbi:MAG TPA: thiolase domain-containing protein [Candidatus Thermoplasmatota archaeon]
MATLPAPPHRSVRMIGAAMSKFGKMEQTLREAGAQAGLAAVREAGVGPAQVDHVYIANAFGLVENQGHLGPLIASSLAMDHAATLSVESACASGGAAIHQAYMAVAGGFADAALVVGVEKVSMLGTASATTYFTSGSDFAFEAGSGGTFPGLYATLATAYLRTFGATEEQLAHVAVKNHKNALSNPNAHLQKAVSVEQVLASPYVSWPLKLYDCCPFSDGAAAVVLAAEPLARDLGKEGVAVLGAGRAGCAAQLQERASLVELPSTRLAAEQAFAQAGLAPRDVSFAEVHDCFTVAEVLATEDLGFFPKGEGAAAAAEGRTSLAGEVPVNPSGGLKAKGHPVGTTGVAQAVEVFEQLEGRAGGRQVKGAGVALTHNIGATGGSCAVHLWGRA